jgi:hypothetical protein
MQPHDTETDPATSTRRCSDESDLELEAWLASPHWPPATAPAVDDVDYLPSNT